MLLPKLARIPPRLRHFRKSLLHHRLVLLVSDAVPALCIGDDFQLDCARLYQVVDDKRYVEFCLWVLLVVLYELDELLAGGLKEIGVQAPEIHGNQRIGGKGVLLPVFFV